MRLQDRAERHLSNIQLARDQSGRVPAGMQIKVKPEVPGNEDVNFGPRPSPLLRRPYQIPLRGT